MVGMEIQVKCIFISLQWQKELQIKMAEEEDAEQNELEKVQKEKEEQFKEIMRRRVEKVKKDTKPYELPEYQQTGGQIWIWKRHTWLVPCSLL